MSSFLLGHKQALMSSLVPVSDLPTLQMSAQSSRVMPGELHINKRFSKTYMSIHPLRPAPLDDMTVSSLWHAVSLYHCVT